MTTIINPKDKQIFCSHCGTDSCINVTVEVEFLDKGIVKGILKKCIECGLYGPIDEVRGDTQ